MVPSGMVGVTVEKAFGIKCPRCWRVVTAIVEYGPKLGVCLRCDGQFDLPEGGPLRDGQMPPWSVETPDGDMICQSIEELSDLLSRLRIHAEPA